MEGVGGGWRGLKGLEGVEGIGGGWVVEERIIKFFWKMEGCWKEMNLNSGMEFR